MPWTLVLVIDMVDANALVGVSDLQIRIWPKSSRDHIN